MANSITYNHPNGYSAKLYGKSSLSVYYEGREVLHTGSRAVNTEDEVLDLLGTMPEFRNKVHEMLKDDDLDDCDI